MWYFCPQPLPRPRVRLYCFPYAGAGWQVFRSWPDKLPDIELWMVRLPGRGRRFHEESLSDMLPLVQRLAGNLKEDWNEDTPFAFFGHSLGARLVFEVTRSLRRRKKPLPVHLLLSACPAPQLPLERRPIHNLPKDAFLAELKARNGTPPDVLANEELLDLLLPTLRADFALYETAVYNSEPPLDIPITVFGGREDTLVKTQALQAWHRQTEKSFSVSYFAGDHFFLRSAEDALLKEIRAILT